MTSSPVKGSNIMHKLKGFILSVIIVSLLDFNHRRIADEYCGGAAVTKFPTKYFRIKLCVESLLSE